MLMQKLRYYPGGVAEWLKAPVLKTGTDTGNQRVSAPPIAQALQSGPVTVLGVVAPGLGEWPRDPDHCFRV